MKKQFVPPPFLFTLIAIPYLTGYIARSMGRKFWPWFIIGMVLPVISILVVVCLRDRKTQKRGYVKLVGNERIF